MLARVALMYISCFQEIRDRNLARANSQISKRSNLVRQSSASTMLDGNPSSTNGVANGNTEHRDPLSSPVKPKSSPKGPKELKSSQNGIESSPKEPAPSPKKNATPQTAAASAQNGAGAEERNSPSSPPQDAVVLQEEKGKDVVAEGEEKVEKEAGSGSEEENGEIFKILRYKILSPN